MKNKSIAIVALGNSCAEYMMAKIRSEKFTDVFPEWKELFKKYETSQT